MEECEVRIEIPNASENMEKIFQIEKLMRDIGISFDTSYDIQEQRRDWEFDYSLKGAKVLFKKMKNGK